MNNVANNRRVWSVICVLLNLSKLVQNFTKHETLKMHHDHVSYIYTIEHQQICASIWKSLIRVISFIYALNAFSRLQQNPSCWDIYQRYLKILSQKLCINSKMNFVFHFSDLEDHERPSNIQPLNELVSVIGFIYYIF